MDSQSDLNWCVRGAFASRLEIAMFGVLSGREADESHSGGMLDWTQSNCGLPFACHKGLCLAQTDSDVASDPSNLNPFKQTWRLTASDHEDGYFKMLDRIRSHDTDRR